MKRITRWVPALLSLAACGPGPVVPERPTWADVQPILRTECASCHGGSAATTGSAHGVVYRLDFYDVTTETCGAAAAGVAGSRFAAAAASQIAFDLTSTSPAIRPRMPPAPAPWLEDWEWQTLLRWAGNPEKGTPARGNRAPIIRLASTERSGRKALHLSVVLEDPDGDSVIGVLTIGDVTLRMDRPGAFAVDIDASQWPVGTVSAQATVCDGWYQATYDLGDFFITG